MAIKWNLRKICADRNIWTAAELQRLLMEKANVDFNHSYVNRLYRNTPKNINLSTLLAICYTLDCSPNDLIAFDYTEITKFKEIQENSNKVVNGDLEIISERKKKNLSKIPLPPI